MTRYLLGDNIDQLIARIASSGTAAWYLTDRLGSVRDITDNTGAVIDHLNYDGFGNVISETQTSNGDRWKWTGREFDAETGLQYNRERYYDPKTGRWITQDPLGLAAGDTNQYRYVTNNTVNSTDPSGMDPPPSGYNPQPGEPLYVPVEIMAREVLDHLQQVKREREAMEELQRYRDYVRKIQDIIAKQGAEKAAQQLKEDLAVATVPN